MSDTAAAAEPAFYLNQNGQWSQQVGDKPRWRCTWVTPPLHPRARRAEWTRSQIDTYTARYPGDVFEIVPVGEPA